MYLTIIPLVLPRSWRGQAELLDFVCVNRYYGWYIDSGRPETIRAHLRSDLQAWANRVHRPLILTEYGAGSLPDVNAVPFSSPSIWLVLI